MSGYETPNNNEARIRVNLNAPPNVRERRRVARIRGPLGPARVANGAPAFPALRRPFNENGNVRVPTNLEQMANYRKNNARVKANKNRNNQNNTIQWKNVYLRNMPADPVSQNDFKPKQKAVRINRTYYSPESFRLLARRSMTAASQLHGNTILFKNPTTRQEVRKNDIEFVVLKKRETNN